MYMVAGYQAAAVMFMVVLVMVNVMSMAVLQKLNPNPVKDDKGVIV
jgi:hypothetical protein